MPVLPKDPMYSEADPEMEFRVVKQGLRPGRVKLGTLAVPRLSSEAVLSSRIEQEVTDRKAAVTAEAAARSGADAMLASSLNTEAQARAAADTTLTTNLSSEVTARTNADAALQTQITALAAKIVPLSGTLTLPGGVSLLVGKSTRTVNVTGLRVGDNLVVTPNAALPANISMGEAYCLTAGVLTVVVLNTALLALNISTTQNIPLGIIALRP